MKTTKATDKLWQDVLEAVKSEVSTTNFAAWFSKTSVAGYDSDQLVISVPNAFTKKQLQTQFKSVLDQALVQNRIDPQTLAFSLDPQKPSRRKTSAPVDTSQLALGIKPPKDSVRHRYRQGLNTRYSLDNFVVGSCNDFAYAACEGVLKNPGKKYNPLFIYGGVGTGKTHLIQAVGNQVVKDQPKLRVVYATIEQFVQEFTESIRRKKIESFAHHYRGANVLIIDDIQFIANKEKTQEEFFHTFNILLEAEKQVIISSDKPPEEIPTLESRLCSRFQMGMTVDIQPPDFETCCAIIQTKTHGLDLEIDHPCTEYLATNFGHNIRELEGAIKKLEAYCEVKKAPVSLDAAKAVFEDIVRGRRQRLTPKRIIDHVANYYNLKSEDLTSPNRHQDILEPRQLAMYLIRHELHLSYPKTAASLGRKDHTTAIHSVKKVGRRLADDPQLKQELNAIRKVLQA